MTLTRNNALATALLLTAAPLLAACGGSADAAHDACVGEAASQAAAIEGVDASAYEGDYDLMSLCDELTAQFEDEGRIIHVVECIAEYVGGHIDDGGVFSGAYREGTTVPDLMDDPTSIGVCV